MKQSSTPLWQDGFVCQPREPLNENAEVDVTIVGGGYTGLWTAYYLKKLEPRLSVIVLEANTVGFGGSGRNGGWCSAFLPMSPSEMAAQHGNQAMQFIQREMFSTLDEIERVTIEEKIDCGFHKGGTLTNASNKAHIDRLQDYVQEWHASGFDDDVMRWEDADQLSDRVKVQQTFGGVFSPHCAVVHPYALVQGLASAVEKLGVRIYENSRVMYMRPHVAQTQRARVRSKWIVQAVESFASQLRGSRRSIAPLYSLMVATEPLSQQIWNEIGWSGRETFADGRNMVTYAQRTSDGRIAFGGRGAPYHFGSRISPDYDQHRNIHERLREAVRETFPELDDVKFTHAWGGPVGATRDWHAFANVDRGSGVCAGGGYVGDGVALSNLIARTLANQIVDTDSPLTQSLVVNHFAKKWEIEPLRWLGINGLLKVTGMADARERHTAEPATRLLAFRDGFLD